MGVLPSIQSLADLQLAILPDVARYDLPADILSSIPESYTFKLPTTPFLYTSQISDLLNARYKMLFIPSNTPEEKTPPIIAYRWRDKIIVPIPEQAFEATTYSATSDGPSLDLRRDLVKFANDHTQSLYILGGKLENTSWGDPACVSPTLRYLSAHPWIRFLTDNDLLNIHPSRAYTPDLVMDQPNNKLEAQILPALLNAPPGPITDQAWQTILYLQTPASTELTQLRAGYYGIIGHLLKATQWAARPEDVTDCSVDIDWDGQNECILASPDFFTTLEPSGGYIVAAFARRADGVHQIIAPYDQFVVGLGDPSTWDPSRGSAADPALVPGGFVDGSGPWLPKVESGRITFTSGNNDRHKTFILSGTGLRVEYSSASPIAVQISLGLDPWRRFTTGWGDAYRETAFLSGWEWALDPGPQVKITTSGKLKPRAFTASRAYLSVSEDPNFEYPPGHYLPFPLALVEIQGQDNFFIQLDVP
jgi:hypothetical protein